MTGASAGSPDDAGSAGPTRPTGPAGPTGPTAGPAEPATLVEPPPRRGGIGPFSWRQLLTVAGSILVAAVVLTLATRPITVGPAGPTPLPGPTAYLVGPAVEGLRPGDMAPELEAIRGDGSTVTLADLDGRPVRLADLRGKLVWLNFWATWCPPCQAETPVLRDVAAAYRDRGLVIVGIAVQETTVEDVRAYADRYAIDYPVAFDASADIFHRYRVFALPTQVFIGPDGRILQVVSGPLDRAAADGLIRGWLPPGS